MESLHFVDACTSEHFFAMSRIHALGWRTTYQDAVPAAYMAREITGDRWVPSFRDNYESGRCHGLLLYNGNTPVVCCNYGPARAEDGAYSGWGEIISFYAHPAEKGKGYGGLLMEEALRRLRISGFSRCYVLVLRENENARRFYSDHGFAWDGTQVEIPFPPDTVCIDLRYAREL